MIGLLPGSGTRKGAALVALGVFTLLASSGSIRPAPAQGSLATHSAGGGTLVVGQAFDAANLDPHNEPRSGTTTWVFHYVYDTLVTMGDSLQLQPSIATSWKQVSPKVYVFDIRKGVRFSNGRQLTVNDVVGSLRRIISPKSIGNWKSHLLLISSVKADGPWRVRVTLTAPRASFLPALASPFVSVLPMKELRAGTFDPAKEMLGTGPFKFVSHSKNESWTFTRNPRHWRTGLPKADKLTVRIIPDDAARLAALRTGTVGVAIFTAPGTASLLKGVPKVTTVVQDPNAYYRLDVNNSPSSLFSDPRLRRALSLAINRAQIISTALAGLGKPSAAVAPGFGVCPATSMPLSRRDTKTASELVAQAGARGKSVLIVGPSYDSTLPQVAQVLQQNLNAIGLDASVLQTDSGETVERVYSGKADFDLNVDWFPNYGDPSMVLGFWDPALAGGWNKAWLPADQTLNALIAKSAETSPGPARNKSLLAACKRIATDGNMIPLVTKTTILGYRSDLVSPRVHPVEGYNVFLRRIAEFAPRK